MKYITMPQGLVQGEEWGFAYDYFNETLKSVNMYFTYPSEYLITARLKFYIMQTVVSVRITYMFPSMNNLLQIFHVKTFFVLSFSKYICFEYLTTDRLLLDYVNNTKFPVLHAQFLFFPTRFGLTRGHLQKMVATSSMALTSHITTSVTK